MMRMGLDPGFGATKAGLIREREVETSVTLSVVGPGALKKTSIQTGLGRATRYEKPQHVKWASGEYLVGENVHRHVRSIERLDVFRFANGAETKALIYGTLFQALGAGQHSISLLIGLPVLLLDDPSLANSTRGNLRNWLVGGSPHQYQVDGQEISLTVEKIKTTAQPLGGLFAWGFSTEGKWIRKDHPQATVAIVDWGYNDFDLFVVQGNSIQERYSGSQTVGMRRTTTSMANTIRDRFGVNMTLAEVDALVRGSIINGQPPLVHSSAGTEDITPILTQALEDGFGEAMVQIEKADWGNATQFRRVLFVGGGAQAHKRRIQQAFPHAIVLGQTSIVEGLTKFAQRSVLWR
jgi:hypothetical protein